MLSASASLCMQRNTKWRIDAATGATCRDTAVAAAACKAVAAVVAADTAGETLLEVVQLVADLVKARDCRCKPEVAHFPMQ